MTDPSRDTSPATPPPVPTQATILREANTIALNIARAHGERLGGLQLSRPETVTCPEMHDGQWVYVLRLSYADGTDLPELRVAYDGKTWRDAGSKCGECHTPGGDYLGGPASEETTSF